MKKYVEQMILNWNNKGIEPNWDDISINDMREAYHLNMVDKDTIETWMYYRSESNKEVIDLLKELEISININRHYFGFLTKEEEEWNKDYDFYEKENENLQTILTNHIKQFTTKKEWMDFMNWMNEKNLVNETMYNSCKKQSETKWLKFIKGKNYLGRKVEDIYICELWNYNPKYKSVPLSSAIVDNMKERLAYFSELKQFFN